MKDGVSAWAMLASPYSYGTAYRTTLQYADPAAFWVKHYHIDLENYTSQKFKSNLETF
jgi:hypothetical protein